MENLPPKQFETKQEVLYWYKNQIETILRQSNTEMYPQEIRREIIRISGVNIGLQMIYNCLIELEITNYVTSKLGREGKLFVFKITENCPPAKSLNTIVSEIMEIRR